MNRFTDNAPCYFLITDENGFITDVNNTLCIVLNYQPAEITGRHIEFIFTIASKIYYQTHFSLLLKLKETNNEIFITLKSKDNKHIPVLWNEKRIDDAGKTNYVFTGLLVENRKKFEDELIHAKKTAEKALEENTALLDAKKKLNDNLQHLSNEYERTKSINHQLLQFSHAFSHTIKEPVRKTTIFAGLLKDNSHSEQELHAIYLERLLKNVQQINHVVTGLQSYTDLNPHEEAIRNLVYLDQVLEKVQQQLIQESGDVFRITSNSLPRIYGHADQLYLLFYQVLLNAVVYRQQDQQAEITIHAKIVQKNRLENLPGEYAYTDHLQLTFHDRGIGFETAFKHQVFELFKKAHITPGIGLGLALCKKIAENHHGKISAESAPGQGTTITVILPINASV